MLTVRSATPADQQGTVELWFACNLVISQNDPVADFRFATSGTSSDVLVGVGDEGRIEASVMVGHDGHRGWLYYVASAPRSRGRGFGRQMIRAAEDWLRQRGIVKVQLLVRDTNRDVVAFYARLGFETAPRIVMNRRLDTTG